MLKSALDAAALGKVAEMDNTDDQIASRARTEILDRLLGKPTQRQEIDMSADLSVESESLADAISLLSERAADFSSDDGD